MSEAEKKEYKWWDGKPAEEVVLEIEETPTLMISMRRKNKAEETEKGEK